MCQKPDRKGGPLWQAFVIEKSDRNVLSDAESWSLTIVALAYARASDPAPGFGKMDTQAYLQRINYTGPLTRSAETLRQLQVAHLRTVPFENLSIHSGEPIVLDDEALFEKIVHRRRGGFCYELNGLFAALLRALGFEVSMLSAQVANAEGHYGPDFDHMTLMVTLSDRWLVDVGFGDSFLEPLPLDEQSEQVQRDRSYRIVREGPSWLSCSDQTMMSGSRSIASL